MNEFWRGQSKEKEFLIDRESGYFRALDFANDPVSFLEEYKLHHLDDGGSEEELGIQIVEYIREMCHVIQNENVPIIDKRISSLASAEDMSPEWAKIVFLFLKEAGYSKACIKTWLLLDEPFIGVDEEINNSRALNKQLEEIYGVS